MMAEAVAGNAWARRLTWLALALSVGAVTAALAAAVGAGQGAWHFRPAFTVLRWAFYAAIAGGVAAVAALALGRRGGRWRLNLLALAVSAAFVAYLGSLVATARSVPAIHDISTDLEDVPQFRALRVRDDNLENVPDMDRAELKSLAPGERWKAIHRESYGDVKPVRVPWSVRETVQKAQTVAEKKGWEIAHVDPARGILEATDTSLFFRFKDDVVVRTRRDPAGGGTIVDMRSISRVGGSDVGVNARRVREFLKDLRQS